MMKKYILPLLIFLSLHAYASTPSEYAPDTLQRELTLQKDYVPVGHQAEKATFNPLDSRGKVALTPIEFARNTYQVGMNVTPQLFNPIENPLAPTFPSQKFHARIFGGYPLYVGGNLGFSSKIGDRGSILLGLDHLSRKNLAAAFVTPFAPQNITHDTEIGMRYDHALDNRILQVGISAYHHLHTFYGHTLNPASKESPIAEPQGESDYQETYNLFRFNGISSSFSITPAPFSLLSGWQYSATAQVGINRKEDPINSDPVAPILWYASDATNLLAEKTNELDLNILGNLGYTFSGSDWGVGIDSKYQYLYLSPSVKIAGTKAAHIFSIAPHIQYNSPTFLAKLGANVEMLNRGNKSVLVTPDVELRWKTSPLLSLYAVADGGAELMGLRELYQLNRYAEASSIYSGYNITQYRFLLGLQMGNYNGFAFDLYAGYANYSDYSEWAMQFYPAPIHPTIPHTPFDFVTFQRMNKGGVNEAFLSALARYVSNFGLDFSANWKFSKYNRNKNSRAKTEYLEGIPTSEINLTANYSITDKLSAGISFNGLAGITFYPSDKAVHLPFIPELDARISYKAHKNLGLSLIGKNIFNNKTARWMYYERPGATIIGALTITL